jgi:hypothetical protein
MDINILHSQEDGIVAFVGGGQASATVLNHTFNMIDFCSNTNDSCKTDLATVGKIREVLNYGIEDMELFPAVGERFQDGQTLLAINESIIIAVGNGQKLRCFTTGIFRFN